MKGRPLVIVDVDEVLGLFIEGFERFVTGRGFEFRLDRFALFQNIFRPGETEHLPVAEGRRLFDDFFGTACGELTPAPGGAEALRGLSARAQVVIFTNAPAQARMLRAQWLARHGLDYPLLLGSGPKGPAARSLVRRADAPAAFVDDLLPNLDSVAESAPHVATFQHVADPRLRPLAPAAPERHPRIDDWAELATAIEQAIS
ncbi:MAG: hypothetical protein WCY15_09285 [Phenylobacterium sp.]|uniref:hypothetical protein n=1 Tax=Phenylobacterium sp. TaxID=1871053 RepID=UPI002A3237BE|nr:hypothetical protein [Phenylobacterium sp.]MDD3837014.1 hypothetical protein [Phenylobacterium sp.]MDX9997926.1 hypothetical protein [Phenylobacterium sp.]